MQRESVRFDVNMPAAVVRIPRVEERPQLGLVRRHHRQQVRLERVRGQLLHALRPPHLVVLVAEEPVPTFTHQRTIPQILQLQVGKDQLQHVVRNVRRVLGEVVIHRAGSGRSELGSVPDSTEQKKSEFVYLRIPPAPLDRHVSTHKRTRKHHPKKNATASQLNICTNPALITI